MSGDALLRTTAVCLAWCLGAAFFSPARAEGPPPEAEHRSDDATSHRSFEDVRYWRKIFDDPERGEWQKPKQVVGALRLQPGMAVADLGAGTGYFLSYLSRAVGERGAVFAVEVEPKLVEHVRDRADEESLGNIVPVLASADGAGLPNARIDVVLIVDTYHHIDDRLAYLRRLAGVLTANGRVAVIDWFKRELPKGPPPDHKLSREHVLEEMRAAGYELVDEPAFLPYQYFLIFRPKAAG